MADRNMTSALQDRKKVTGKKVTEKEKPGEAGL
jgi:hypothetical protein